METLKITERGWAGHYILGPKCKFHRNTLIERGDKRMVVSTVGNYVDPITRKIEPIGYERYYETMAFEAKRDGAYWEADVEKQIDFKSKWAIDKCEAETDLEADEMHETVVRELLTFLRETAPKKENTKQVTQVSNLKD